MEWTEVSITVPVERVDEAGDIAQMVVPYGIYIEDYSMLEDEVQQIAHIDLIDEDLLDKDRSKGVVHIYISPEDNPVEAVAFLKERYTQADIPFEINTTGCQEQDWLNNWKQYFNPIEVGEKILIRPTWRDKYDPKGRVVLNLDPGLAFGTGTHETTRLCLQAVEKYTTPDTEMLDVGCGSGILSVAALLLGAKSAVGVDIDEMAVKTAKENAVLNGVEDRFTVLAGNLTDKVEGKYNVVAANIVADAIIMLSKDIKNYMYDDSVYIMSGIIDTRVDDVLNAIGDTFEIKEKLLENGWCCLVATLKEQK
ncbi:50S ribosomal protein L11 methyltransferase [Oscillospiraceae bacterium LCP25S3_E10]|nr:50S ribosomal protein L11 methyltransferase [Ruminococcus sp.]MDY2856913.1 50S ribosomal protein L11 methyltransferase [Oscillospiraceae bacterium]